MMDSNQLNKIVGQISQQTENMILEQLNELIKRGLLVLEKGPMQITVSKSPDNYEDRLHMSQPIRLRLKDQEYIEALEKRVEQLQQISIQPIVRK